MATSVIAHPRATDDIRALAYYYTGMTAYSENSFDKALSSFNAVVRINSAELAAESRYHIALIYEQKGEHEVAAKLAEESARANVGYPSQECLRVIRIWDVRLGR